MLAAAPFARSTFLLTWLERRTTSAELRSPSHGRPPSSLDTLIALLARIIIIEQHRSQQGAYPPCVPLSSSIRQRAQAQDIA